MSSRDQTQVTKLGGNCSYLLITGPLHSHGIINAYIIWRISENRKKNDYLHFSTQKVLSVLFVFQMFINCTVLIFVPGGFAVDIQIYTECLIKNGFT